MLMYSPAVPNGGNEFLKLAVIADTTHSARIAAQFAITPLPEPEKAENISEIPWAIRLEGISSRTPPASAITSSAPKAQGDICVKTVNKTTRQTINVFFNSKALLQF
jgi:hypothetical protein